jgi:hypothetical protein
VAGIPIVVDASGVHIKDSSVPAKVLTTVVNTALKAAGLTLSLVKPHAQAHRGSASANPGGLIITSGKIGQILLGGAQLSVAGTQIIPFGAPPSSQSTPPASTTPDQPGTTGTLPAGPTLISPTSPARAPITAPAAASLPAAGSGLGAGWLVGALLTSMLIAAAARRVPALLVPSRTDHCPGEER